MASLSKVALETDEKVQATILDDLKNRPTSSVISVNALVAYLRTMVPATHRSDRQLAKMVFEAAMQLGLVPVYDPEATAAGPSGDFRGRYGYGHRAHKADPDASYGFEPDGVRPLPVRTRSRWR
ncbi:MAG: hypothetical protein BGN87_19465 [Rhizobiales bacterium 65-79]|jgi:hypothetical protein|nr:hypothetical protein [Hyphomicrobiales bacterium]OJU02004.1 MAG: hypothetical protein BGN87_19465 [Rhizobiales bacterium 65-79]